MTDLPNPHSDNDTFLVAGALAAKWLAAYHAQGEEAPALLAALTSDPRTFALSLTAMAEIILGVLGKFDADGRIEGVSGCG